jgi:peptide methionine sulfoxide reductase msrA/msrB
MEKRLEIAAFFIFVKTMKENYFSHLSNKEKDIIIDKGTETPFSGEYNDFFEAGVFVCRACKSALYESNTKFNSGCGWPSFDDEIEGSIVRYEDLSGERVRTEICCKKCNGHLGHVFHGEQITQKDTRHCVNSLSIKFIPYNNLQKAYFGAGCFWTIEKVFREINGVYLSHVGYMGGDTENPTYVEVCKGDTNHAEVIEIYFDKKIVSFEGLLSVFWGNHNPTTLNQQGVDIGTQYRSVIFYSSELQKQNAIESSLLQQEKWKRKIVTQIIKFSVFYRAEEYHQNYLNKNNISSCGL